MSDGKRKIAVVGAGVIGQVYAGRLAGAGYEVWLLARGETFRALHSRGVCLHQDGLTSTPSMNIVDSTDQIPDVDVVYLAVRADQVDTALPVIARISAPVVVTLVNLADQAGPVAATIGADRVVLGFAGVGGTRAPDGVTYRQVEQQPTTIGEAGGRETDVLEDLRATGLHVDTVPDMPSWLATHAVFIVGVGAAILEAGGSEQLGNDRGRSTRMVMSIRDGFKALTRQGIPVTPTPLRVIFTLVPRPISVPYWQKQMRGEMGRLSLAPHITATRDTEFRHLAVAARRLTRNSALLDAALTAAGFPSNSREPQE